MGDLNRQPTELDRFHYIFSYSNYNIIQNHVNNLFVLVYCCCLEQNLPAKSSVYCKCFLFNILSNGVSKDVDLISNWKCCFIISLWINVHLFVSCNMFSNCFPNLPYFSTGDSPNVMIHSLLAGCGRAEFLNSLYFNTLYYHGWCYIS